MLSKLTITKENELWHRLNRTDFDQISFNFKPGVNVIIGRNGIGKSTVIEAINNAWVKNKSSEGLLYEEKKMNNKERIYIFSAEENNPKRQLSNISMFDPDYADKTVHWLNRSEMSSGVQTKEFFDDAMYLSENARIIILDEPEQALDAESMLYIKKELKEKSKDTQFIIVSHHPAFILDPDFNILEFDPEKPYKPSVEKLVLSLY